MSKTIFLSYARGDDEQFVARLHADLGAHGFDVWWDRVSMPARGLTFLHEIREAIDSRERFLLVVGPKATASDYVVAEWQHAVTYGKALNPILRLGDFPLVPDELKLLHVEDFRDDTRYAFHLTNLVRQLSQPIAPMGKLVGVPSLPRHLLTRPDRLQSLKDALLADLHRPAVMTGVAARVGVQGMGGIGKSVLANLLARDTEVRRAFPDGVFWVPIGLEPNLVALQRDVAKVFAEPGYFENVAQGRAKLGEILASKAVLLVLDDVWDRAHAEAFNVLGPRCRAVITTRDAGLVTSLGGTQHQVQLPTEAESLDLLAAAAELSRKELPPEARKIVSECGCLPLAVALCAGMVKRGVAWTSILQRLKQTALETIADRNAGSAQHRNLWIAMKVSVDALPPDQQKRFIELSVFPNDEAVPEAAVRTLWSHTGGLDNFACEDLLIGLRERSLIRIDTEPPQTGQVPRHRVSLHDLLHDFATELADDLVPLHKQLLDAYRKHCPNGWPSGPNDGYLFEHLPTHLSRAGQWSELKQIVQPDPLCLIQRWTERGAHLQGIECMTGLLSGAVELDRIFAANLASQLGFIHALEGNSGEAVKWFDYALDRTSYWRGRRFRAIALHERATVHLHQEEFGRAAAGYRKAIALCEWGWPQFHDEIAANLVGLATVRLAENRFREARWLAWRAQRFARRAGDVPHLIAAHRLSANVALAVGDWHQVEAVVNSALEMCRSANVEFEKARLLMLLGRLRYVQDNIAAACSLFLDALREAQKVQNLYAQLEAMMNLGWSAFVQNRVGDGVSWFGRAAELLPAREQYFELHAWAMLGKAAEEHLSSRFFEAEKSYTAACSFCDEHRIRYWQVKALVGIGALQWGRRTCEDADRNFDRAKVMAHRISPGAERLLDLSIGLCKANPLCIPR